MAKRCPRCGAVFADAARYCDLDGAELVPVRGRWGSRLRRAGIVGAVLVLLAAGSAVPSLAERYLRLKVDIDLVEVRLSGMGDENAGLLDTLAGIAQTLSGDATLDVHLEVHNGTPLRVSLVSASYVVEAGGKEMATGVWIPDPSPQLFAPGQELPIDLTTRPKAASALALGSQVLHGRQPEVQVRGNLTVAFLWTTLTLPFEGRGARVSLGPGPEPAAPARPRNGEAPQAVGT